MRYERNNISALKAYVPGEQKSSPRIVKLNTNENPYDPSPKVMQAIAQVTGTQLRKYPSPNAATFRKTAADLHNLSQSQIIATNAGDELLRLIITVFAEPKTTITTQGGIGLLEPSYSLYPVLAEINNSSIFRVPLNQDWSIPESFPQQLNDAGVNVAFIVNPHAPTGLKVSNQILTKIAKAFNGVLVIDEAYTDFTDGSAIDLVQQGLENVILLRTLSKGYSLAGLRFGYGIAHESLIAAMDKARDSYNTDAISQAAATASLKDQDYAKQTWINIISERKNLQEELLSRNWQVIQPSQSNFLLVTPPATAIDSKSIYQQLVKQDILVRYFDQPRLDDKLRITIGTPDENKALLAALDKILKDK